MTITMIPFAEGEALLDWIALTDALAHGHTLPKAEIGRASCRKECAITCRSRWSPYH